MLRGLARLSVPAALVNARMTAKTLANWKSRKPSAKQIFSAFGFIGAADSATADGLASVLARPIDIIGNLKTAMPPEAPSSDRIAGFRGAVGPRPILLAASTHPGEDEIALDAFVSVRKQRPTALLILVPRHPERADAITALARTRKLDVQRWSQVRTPPAAPTEVLLADTIGELMFWYAASDAVYLGGASVEGIGGHNPIEPAALGKRVFTGPHGFNFRPLFADFEKAGALTVGEGAEKLANWWAAELDGPRRTLDIDSIFAAAREPFEKSLEAVAALLPKAAGNA
jgi:3-deoxy-D-manno-octulosonic-acid transferase